MGIDRIDRSQARRVITTRARREDFATKRGTEAASCAMGAQTTQASPRDLSLFGTRGRLKLPY